MSAGAILSMIIILGSVAGGFVYFVLQAVKKENQHKQNK